MPPMNRTKIKKAPKDTSGMSIHNFKTNVKNEIASFKKLFTPTKSRGARRTK
jgi:hypothetical protein